MVPNNYPSVIDQLDYCDGSQRRVSQGDQGLGHLLEDLHRLISSPQKAFKLPVSQRHQIVYREWFSPINH